MNGEEVAKRIAEINTVISQKQQRLGQIEQERNQLTVDVIGLSGALAELQRMNQPIVVGEKPAQPSIIQKS